MKKISMLILVLMLVCMNVCADTLPDKGIVMRIGNNAAVVDGKREVLDVAPEINNDRTFVPIRFCSQAMAADVIYVEQTQTVVIKKGNKTVELIIGTCAYKVNGDLFEADTAPYIKEGRTMVPVRIVAEALNTQVKWYDETEVITIGFESEQTAVKEYLKDLFV